MLLQKNCLLVILICGYLLAGCLLAKKNSNTMKLNSVTQTNSSIMVTAPFVMPGLKVFKHPGNTYPITNYGAIQGGNALNTKAIVTAIKECNAKGGGTVLIPNGKWLTGKIHLQSNVNLHLQDSAELIF